MSSAIPFHLEDPERPRKNGFKSVTSGSCPYTPFSGLWLWPTCAGSPVSGDLCLIKDKEGLDGKRLLPGAQAPAPPPG